MRRADDIRINLLTPKIRQEQSSSLHFMAVLVLIIITYGGMGVLGYVTHQARVEASQYNAALIRELNKKREVARLVSDVEASQALVDNKTRQVTRLGQTSINCTKVLGRIEESLPEGAVITKLELDRKQITLQGFARDYRAVAGLIASLSKQWGGSAPQVLRCEEATADRIYFEITVAMDQGGLTG